MLHSSDDVAVPAAPRLVQETILHLHEDPGWWPGLACSGGYGWLELDAPCGPSSRRLRFKVRIEEAREWEGFRWVFEDGALDGSAEFWLQPFRSSTIVHYMTSIERTRGKPSSTLRLHRWQMRAGLNALKDRFSA